MSEKKAAFQPTTDLKSIGETLKNKREEHSYTLEHVSEITRITLTNLKHIEEGNLDALPGLVFVRGFIRNYAKLLGLESDWMIEALNQAYSNRTQPQPIADQEKIIESSVVETPESDKKKVYISVFALAVIILIVLFIFWNFKSINQYSGVGKKVETIQAVDNNDVPQAVEKEVLKETKQNALPKEEPAAKPVISPLTLTLVALESDWISLSIDNQAPQLVKLEKGKKYDWPGNEEFKLIMTTGNSALIHLNGEEIVDRENYPDELYEAKLNKFTLTRINNR